MGITFLCSSSGVGAWGGVDGTGVGVGGGERCTDVGEAGIGCSAWVDVSACTSLPSSSCGESGGVIDVGGISCSVWADCIEPVVCWEASFCILSMASLASAVHSGSA